MQNDIINQIITGEVEMVLSTIAKNYQTSRQGDQVKLRIDILTVGRLTDPIYITPENEIIDGFKRLEVLKELYKEGFKLVAEPTVVIIDTYEKQEEIYISKNIMINRFTKSWLAVIAVNHSLPENRRIAAARRGIKQDVPFNACKVSAEAFGLSDKLVQQAETILNSPYGEFVRGKIRENKITVTNAYEIINKNRTSILDDMEKGKTYQQAINIYQRDKQGDIQHRKFQEREKFRQEKLLDYQKSTNLDTTPDSQETQEIAQNIEGNTQDCQGNQDVALANKVLASIIELKTVYNQTKFFGALNADCSPEFKDGLAELMKKHIPNSHIVFVKDINKIQQLIHEEEKLEYFDSIDIAS